MKFVKGAWSKVTDLGRYERTCKGSLGIHAYVSTNIGLDWAIRRHWMLHSDDGEEDVSEQWVPAFPSLSCLLPFHPQHNGFPGTFPKDLTFFTFYHIYFSTPDITIFSALPVFEAHLICVIESQLVLNHYSIILWFLLIVYSNVLF